MKGMRVYQYANILSLDVTAGAVICSLFFARIFHISPSIFSLAALALTVWVIYTIDHLRDARSIQTIASTDRHRFHQRHFKVMLIILSGVVAADFALLWFLPRPILVWGAILASVVFFYLILQRHLKFMKEFFVALLYSAGILLPSLSEMNGVVDVVQWVLIGKFFITALMNLLLFSLIDYEEDRYQQQHSFVTWFGRTSTRRGILFLGLLNILLGVVLWSFDATVAVIFIAMNLMLLLILFFQKKLVANNYYRLLGDAVFFIPVVYLL